MKIDYEGRTWLLEPLDAGVKQSETIAAYSGQPSLMAWYRSLTEPESAGWLKSMQCLHWLMKAQNGVDVDLATAEFTPLRLFTAFSDAADAETKEAKEAAAAAEAALDPTNGGAEPAEESEPTTASPSGSPG